MCGFPENLHKHTWFTSAEHYWCVCVCVWIDVTHERISRSSASPQFVGILFLCQCCSDRCSALPPWPPAVLQPASSPGLGAAEGFLRDIPTFVQMIFEDHLGTLDWVSPPPLIFPSQRLIPPVVRDAIFGIAPPEFVS